MRHLEVLRKLYRGRKKMVEAPDLVINDAFSVEAMSQLKDRGIHIVPDFLPLNQITEIKNALDRVLDQISEHDWQQVELAVVKKDNRFGVSLGEEWKFWTDKARSDQRISHAEFVDPMIGKFANDDRFLAIGSAYLERGIALKFCMANRTQYKPNNLGSGGGWHRDNNYKRGFKALLYLTDSDEENGCFQYLERSASIFHHLLKTPFPDKYQFTHEEVLAMVDRDEHKITSASARAGTLVLFDTNGVHRGKPLAEGGRRYAITNYYND
jgi:Phytanoyl-CoA dioxygenase (PhyH)